MAIKRKKKQVVDEVAMAKAISDIKNGLLLSYRKAAKKYNLCHETIRKRMNGVLPKQIAHRGKQLFTPQQEKEIVKWIIESDEAGNGRSRHDIVEYAELFLLLDRQLASIGGSWFERFKKRHKEIHVVQGRKISSLRVKAATPDQIKEYFHKYDLIVRQHQIPNENIFNYDESGFIMGQGKSSRVAVPSYKNRTYVKSTEGRDSCTVIEAISMSGEKLIPGIIFKGQTLRTGWFNDDAPDYYYSVSKCGYTSYWLSWRWLEEVFIPQVKEKTNQGKVLLIMDGHGSHKTKKFRETCEDNNIIPLYLPPHSTHLLQPLDLGIFGPIKYGYKAKLSKLAHALGTDPVKQQLFLLNYYEARQEKLTKERIIRFWETAGLNPFDVDKVLNSSQMIAAKINKEIDDYENNRDEHTQQDDVEIGLYLRGTPDEELIDKLTKKIDFLELENTQLKTDVAHLQAELTSAKLEIDNYKEALKNKKPPGRSSAIPMDENQGFKRAAPYAKEYRQNPPKKNKRKALTDTTNCTNGSNSYIRSL